MTDLDALLAGIVAHPHEVVRWLIVADWLDDHGFADRAELLRLHRMLIDTCCEPDAHPERTAWQARIVELIDRGVKPCIPQHTLMLPGGVPLVGNFIPPGSFLMGSEVEEDEKPIRRASLAAGFFIGNSPVTVRQWTAVMSEPPSISKDDMHPVENVSWRDAKMFCDQLTLLTGYQARLPTEVEWEYACRAGTTTHFHYGDVPSPIRMNYDWRMSWNGSIACGNPSENTTDVWRYPPNPWGLFDCHGNEWEWCEPVSPPATWVTERGAQMTLVEQPQLRGGSWLHNPEVCRSSARYAFDADQSDIDFGFRVVFTLS